MSTDKDMDHDVEFIRTHLQRPIVLVGMMGVGKTHTGRKLADRLGLDFVDSDKLVEEKAGCTVADIFEKFGEEKFRQAERNTILSVLADGPRVLATGGGAILNEETRKAIKRKSVSIWIQTSIPDILKRIGEGEDRPLLKKGDPQTILVNLLKQREPFYAEADIQVESKGANSEETLGILIKLLSEYLKDATV